MSTDDRVVDPFLDDAVPALPPPRRRVRLDRTPVPVPETQDAPRRRPHERRTGGVGPGPRSACAWRG